jgi:hypothetical protein
VQLFVNLVPPVLLPMSGTRNASRNSRSTVADITSVDDLIKLIT